MEGMMDEWKGWIDDEEHSTKLSTNLYGMGHEEVRSCNGNCVPFPCLFGLHISVFIFYCATKIILRTCNGEKNGEKNVGCILT